MTLEEALSELRKVDKVVRELFVSLDEHTIHSVPSNGKWSVAQHLDHLIMINRSYFPVIDEVRKGEYKVPWHGRFRPLVNWFGKLVLRSVQPENKKKTRTFPIWEPGDQSGEKDVLETFLAHQEELRVFFASNKDLFDNHAVIPSPANKNILYTFDKATEIIVVHEWRHIDHIRELLEK